ncbi:MAG TPA: hypothetical protein VKE91_07120, partial [Blastocatellia bacterium]|nr:hypothetical protein [Blastocatellia bacterium]
MNGILAPLLHPGDRACPRGLSVFAVRRFGIQSKGQENFFTTSAFTDTACLRICEHSGLIVAPNSNLNRAKVMMNQLSRNLIKAICVLLCPV